MNLPRKLHENSSNLTFLEIPPFHNSDISQSFFLANSTIVWWMAMPGFNWQSPGPMIVINRLAWVKVNCEIVRCALHFTTGGAVNVAKFRRICFKDISIRKFIRVDWREYAGRVIVFNFHNFVSRACQVVNNKPSHNNQIKLTSGSTSLSVWATQLGQW